MKKLTSLLFFLLIISYGFAQETYLYCGKLVDTKTGKIQKEMTIIVSGNKITSVQKGYIKAKSTNDRTIDLKSKTVMPGLIDMHVHIQGETSPTRYLEVLQKMMRILPSPQQKLQIEHC